MHFCRNPEREEFLKDLKIGLYGGTAFLDVLYAMLKVGKALPCAVERKDVRSGGFLISWLNFNFDFI